MANAQLFQSSRGRLLPDTDSVNRAGGKAYSLSAEQGLAQYAVTGCLNSTFYADASQVLDEALELAKKCSLEFVGQAAIYSRKNAFLKDFPALLCVYLSTQGPEGAKVLKKVFPVVIDNAKMLRNYVQITRSGRLGRKSFGSLPRRLIRDWLNSREPERIFKDSVGKSPSMADIIKMVHPKPRSAERDSLYAYLVGKPYQKEGLPRLVQFYEAWKVGKSGDNTPDVPFQMLTGLPLTNEQWTAIAKNAKYQMTRMNLNTFMRHGVFENEYMVDLVAERLRDREAIVKSRQYPYQLYQAFEYTGNVPRKIQNALQDAIDISLENVPVFDGNIVVCPDVSGSMKNPITGGGTARPSTVRCLDVASLIAAAMFKRNTNTTVLPFSDVLSEARLNPRDSVATITKIISSARSGGTQMSLPLEYLVREKKNADLVIYVSDNESWLDPAKDNAYYGRSQYGSTATLRYWEQFKQNNRNARLVCVDLVPCEYTQVPNRDDILNIGGFSDSVFDLINTFANGKHTTDLMVKEIKTVEL